MQDKTSIDSALRAVGRTIVNFQRLEHTLKFAAQLRPIEGNLLRFQREVEKRRERLATLTMGGAIQAWLSAADGKLTESGFTNDLFDATIQIAFSFFPDAETLDGHGAALKVLLETRNNLVHGDLVHVQWNSPEACERLMTKLEAVNQDIDRQMTFLTSILAGVKALGAIRVEDLEMIFEKQPSQTVLE